MPCQLAVSFECTPVGSRHFQPDGEKRPADVVIEAVADAEGVEPVELPPLYESVNPDGLDQLFQTRETDAKGPQALCFTFSGWNVFVRGDGTILVADPDRKIEPTPLFTEAIGD